MADHQGRGRPALAGITLGCDYNPEQWSPSVWLEDVALMTEAGIDLVAINIFGWSDLETQPGRYDFDRLDAVIELLHANGIGINLGTATASPPPWLTAQHPEILPVTADGTRRFPGGRQAWCPSSPVYRRHALALVEQVAKRYGRHPGILLWHVSNELGCHNALCYCDVSAEAFRDWLRQRYGSIAALNSAWGTAFWSQRYHDWAEIQPPRATLSAGNPTQILDFHRFSSDALLDCHQAEAEVLRRHSDVPVTTNFMVTAHIRNLDYWSWAPHVDIVANDHYLDHRLDDPTAELSFAADLTRGLSGGAPWMLMEQAAGAVNWQPYNLAKTPGQMLRNSLTHVARGADSICFFQWRAAPYGAEKFHSALVPHAGTDTAAWQEVLRLSAVLKRLREVAGTRVLADTALIFSWPSWWAADGEGRPSEAVRYLDQVHAVYNELRSLGVTVDIVAPTTDLSTYRLVAIPCLYAVSDAAATRINEYVAGGGHAVVTFFSGIADENDHIRLGGYPGAFRDMLGISVEEFFPSEPGRAMGLSTGGHASLWAENLRLTTARALSRYTDGPLPGVPAVTRNTYGDGTSWYIATALDTTTLRHVLKQAVETACVPATGPEGDGSVEVVRRADGERRYLFAINHGTTTVELPATGHELVDDQPITGTLRVGAGQVRVVREDRPR
ncbi:beta-galactosidase [Krasilnikovia cinnamomea]|uniref:Beta-galactosidase n=1 Tax=Krasilnikovia cinnamomea TaxID=349313 RepID=A0A4V2G7R3_9ACTN|nr:beta-galactosidase [Krasilnikovia cinnamomea]RZU53576.1 beta-galactosidase [Krasilnikovia cinnamomea]